jgi:hypothetical protein
MTTILSADGLLEIPEAFRKADALKPGQRCDIERLGQGEYRVSVEVPPNEGPPDLVSWLFACPEKDWWVEPDRRERSPLKPSTVFDE